MGSTTSLDWVRVIKANPYHDEKGRFTTGGSAAFVSTGEAFESSLKKLRASVAAKEKAAGSKESFTRATEKNWEEHVNRMFDDGTGSWSNLGPEQQRAITGYTSESGGITFRTVVRSRRNDESFISDIAFDTGVDTGAQFDSQIDALDDALNNNLRVTENVVAFRAVNLSGVGLTAGNTLDGLPTSINQGTSVADLEKLVGQEFTDPSYGSTSVRPLGLETFSKSSRVSLAISIPKGARGVALGNSSITEKQRTFFPKEAEVLLPRNRQYRVTGVEVINGTNVLSVDLINGNNPP